MSQTGPDSAADQRNHAAMLSDQAARRLLATKTSLENAVGLFKAADQHLRHSENDVSELLGQVNKVRSSEPEDLRRHLEGAKSYANDARKKMGFATGRFAELETELGEAAINIQEADKALDELERLPGGQTDQTRALRSKLEQFREAVQQASEHLEQSREEFGTAQTTLEPLLDVPEYTEEEAAEVDLDQSANTMQSITADVEGQMVEMRQDLKGRLAKVDGISSEAQPLADEGVAMANALYHAANPTPDEQFVAPGSAQQSALSRRLDGGVERDDERENS